MNPFNEHEPTPSVITHAARLIDAPLAASSILFARAMLPQFCALPFSPLHRRLCYLYDHRVWRMLHGRRGGSKRANRSHQSTEERLALQRMLEQNRTTIQELATTPFAENWGRVEASLIASRRGERWAVAAPRGSAKSTIATLLMPLCDIAFGRERHIVIISATNAQARMRLRAIRAELQGNAALHALCPWLAPPPPRPRSRARHNQEEHIVSPVAPKVRFTAGSLTVNGVQVDAFGALVEIRGISNGPWRPTRIILDDAEASRRAATRHGRAAMLEWYAEIIENLGASYTHIDVIGTILHRDSLLETLLRRAPFTAVKCQSVIRWSSESEHWAEWTQRLLAKDGDASGEKNAQEYLNRHRNTMLRNTRVLWPERESYADLMAMLATQGRAAFYKEKMNAPMDESASFLRPLEWSWLVALPRAGDEAEPIRGTATQVADPRVQFAPETQPLLTMPALNAMRYFAYLDSALGHGATGETARENSARAVGDFASIAVVGVAADGQMVCVEVWAERAVPRVQIARAFDLLERWPIEVFGFEANAFQKLLGHMLNDERERRRATNRAWRMHVREVNNSTPKAMRIGALEPLVASRTLHFVRGRIAEEFLAEAEDYPRSAHDDALDAVAGAVALAKNATPTMRPAVPVGVAPRASTRGM